MRDYKMRPGLAALLIFGLCAAAHSQNSGCDKSVASASSSATPSENADDDSWPALSRGDRILVVGAGSLVGSHFVRRFAEAGHPVRALVDATNPPTFNPPSNIEFITVPEQRTSHRYFDYMGKDAEKAEAVVFALPQPPRTLPPREFRYQLIDPLRSALEAAAHHKAKRFIYISTTEFTALRDGETHLTEYSLRNLEDPYLKALSDAEELVRDALSFKLLPVTILRPGRVYGPGDTEFLTKLVQRLAANRVVYQGSRKNKVHMTYVENLVDLGWEAMHSDYAIGNVFLSLDDKPLTWEALLTQLADSLGLKRPRWSLPGWTSRWTRDLVVGREEALGTGESALRMLGYTPRFTAENGIQLTVPDLRTRLRGPEPTPQEEYAPEREALAAWLGESVPSR